MTRDPHRRPTETREHEWMDRGLAFDLATLVDRRRALTLIAGAGLALAACGGSSDSAVSSTSAADSAPPSSAAGSDGRPDGPPPGGGPGGGMGGESTLSSGDADAIPDETAGPYPGDGSNGPDVLLQEGVVRSDMSSNVDGSAGVSGVALTMTYTVTDSQSGDPLPGRAVYAWHCDSEGRYSMYSEGTEDQTWLRAVQETGADGTVTFTTVFPGCYQGRWPHVHFEVYESLAVATASGEITATSQLAFPAEVCAEVYAEPGYEASVAPFAGVSLESDGIFADSYERQLATMSGSVSRGYTAVLAVPVSA